MTLHPDHRAQKLPFNWSQPPLGVVLVEPDIPPNTGAVARLCAATRTRLHLVGPLGFRLTDAAVRRAGLDYWDSVDLQRHDTWQAFRGATAPPRIYFFSVGATTSYLDTTYQPGDALVFGSETRGLPDSLFREHPDQVRGIPIRQPAVRSLNLAMSVAIVLYEALRQIHARGTPNPAD